MGETNLGKVRGTTWYDGTGISGSSTTPTIFSGSGVTQAYVGDYYLNTNPGADGGNVYCCTTKGAASVAKWVYVGNIRGLQPEIVNNLNSDSVTKALSAAQGKALKNLIIYSGVRPKRVLPKTEQTAYIAEVTIENKSTVLSFVDDDGNTGTYSYTATGDSDDAVVAVNIGTSIGLPNTGAVIDAIESSEAVIFGYVLYDSSNAVIYEDTPVLWEHINDCDEDVLPGGSISETHVGTSYSYRNGKISKEIDSVRTEVFPITHAKATWFNKAASKTVYDAMTDIIGTTDVFNPATNYAAGDYTIYQSALYKFNAAHTGAWTGTDVTKVDVKSVNTQIGTLNTQIGILNTQLGAEESTRAGADASLREAIDNLVSPSGQSVVIDSSLSISGAGADAKMTGSYFDDKQAQIDGISTDGLKKYIIDNLKPVRYNPTTNTWDSSDTYLSLTLPIRHHLDIIIKTETIRFYIDYNDKYDNVLVNSDRHGSWTAWTLPAGQYANFEFFSSDKSAIERELTITDDISNAIADIASLKTSVTDGNIIHKYTRQFEWMVNNHQHEDFTVPNWASLDGLTINLVGDSMTGNQTTMKNEDSSFVTFADYVKSKYPNCTVNLFGHGGSTIAVNENSASAGNSFYERVIGTGTNNVNEDADIWVIWGGYNDVDHNVLTPIGTPTGTELSTLYGSLKAIIQNIQERDNAPRVILVTPHQSYGLILYQTGTAERLRDLRECFKVVGEAYSAPVVDLWSEAGMTLSNYVPYHKDSVHLNQNGYFMCYGHILKAIENGF